MTTTHRETQTSHLTISQTRLCRALRAALIAGVLGSASGLALAAPDKPWKEGQILVKPKAGLSDAEFDEPSCSAATPARKAASTTCRCTSSACRRKPRKPWRAPWRRTPASSSPSSTWPSI